MRPLTSLGAAFLASLLFTNFASADTATLHTTTTQMPGAACSVTAWHRFATVNGRYTMLYGGGTSCAGGSGQFTIDVVPQVFNRVNGQPLWFNISGAGLFQGPTAAAPLRLSASRAAVKGHVYRVLVYARATAPNGRTVSATSNSAPDGTHPTLSIIPSRPINPTPWTTARLPGIEKAKPTNSPP